MKNSLQILNTLLVCGSAVAVIGLSSCANVKGGSSGEAAEVSAKPSVRRVHRVNPNVNLPVGAANGVTHRYGSRTAPYVALTFDDGPHAVHTPRLLNILRSHNVKATFYVTGANAARYPHLIRRMVNEGHEVGNHTYNHPNITQLSDAQVRAELDRTNAAIAQAAGIKPRTFRAPYAAITARQKVWINAQYGYPIAMWAVDPRDWKDRNASLVASRVLKDTSRGSIILLHDIHGSSVSSVPTIINGLLARGYQFATVSQLISNK